MTANEEDAADLTQEAFLRVWQKLPEFRLQAAFSTWLYRLTTNLCLDFMRGRKRRPTVPLEREDEEQTPLPEPKDPARRPRWPRRSSGSCAVRWPSFRRSSGSCWRCAPCAT